MELSFARALSLLAAVPVAWFLARRAAMPPARHALWFLLPPVESGGQRRAARASRRRWLLLAAIAAIALGATGPAIYSGGEAMDEATDGVELVYAHASRDTLRPGHGIVEIQLRSSRTIRGVLTGVSGSDELWRRTLSVSPQSDGRLIVDVARGGAARRVLISFDDKLVGSLQVPALAAPRIVLDESLVGSPAARALSVLPAGQGEPVRISDWQGDGDIAVARDFGAEHFVLRPAPGSPLAGLNAALLVAEGPVRVAAGSAATGDDVWLWAGPHPAIYRLGSQVRVAVELRGPALPIAMAEILASLPRDSASVCRADLHEYTAPGGGCAVVPRVANAIPRRAFWPTWLLFAMAGVLLAIASVLAGRGAAPLSVALTVAAVLAVVLVLVQGRAPAARRVVFAVDVSRSMHGLEDARVELRLAAAALGDHDRAALVLFAGGARVERALGASRRIAEWAETPMRADASQALDVDRSDLAAALRVSAAALGEVGGEIVLISDGYDTSRDAASFEALVARVAPGHSVSVVAMDRHDVAGVSGPLRAVEARAGARLNVPIEIETHRAGVAVLSISRDGDVIARVSVALGVGRTEVLVPVSLVAPGLHRLDVQLEFPGDVFDGNNHAPVLVRVGARPRAIALTGAQLASMGSSEAIDADAVLLTEQPYSAIGPAGAAILEQFARDGGVVLLSGVSTAFGPGGYAGTALDRLSPLRADFRAASEHLALAVVVDRSGSIAAPGKRDAAPTAKDIGAMAAGLRDSDLLAVIAFDSSAHVLRALSKTGAIRHTPQLLPARGGTEPAMGFDAALSELAGSPRDTRRLIALVTDGELTEPAMRRALAAARRARGLGVRVAVLHVGDAGRATVDQHRRLAAIAEAGGGPLLSVGVGVSGVGAAVPALVLVDNAARGSAAVIALKGLELAVRSGFERVFATRERPNMTRYARTKLAADAEALLEIDADPVLAMRAVGRGTIFASSTDSADIADLVVDYVGRRPQPDRLDFRRGSAPSIVQISSYTEFDSGQNRAGTSLRIRVDGDALAVVATTAANSRRVGSARLGAYGGLRIDTTPGIVGAFETNGVGARALPRVSVSIGAAPTLHFMHPWWCAAAVMLLLFALAVHPKNS